MTIKLVMVSLGKAAVGGSSDTEQPALSRRPGLGATSRPKQELRIAACRLSLDYDPWENTCFFQGIADEVQ